MSQKKKHILLWLLGWIFIFPVPITVLTLRSDKLSNKIRCLAISFAWILYMFFVLVNQNSNRNHAEQQFNNSNTDSSIIMTDSETLPENTVPEINTTSEIAEISTDSIDHIKQAIENGDYSLVTPEFKEMMDAYETFYDEYIAFMEKYKESENTTDMMNDYMDMLARLEEWTVKIDAVNEDELSEADNLYYILVTLRVQKKLLELGLAQ